MSTAERRGTGARVWGASRVSPLELLFDLVFLFTVTQVTHVVVEHPDAVGLGRAFVLLTVIYLMYDGYIWLMNQLAGDTDRAVVRVTLLVAMVAFLVMAASVPTAFDEGRGVFAGALIVAVVIHAVLLAVRGPRAGRRAMRIAGPLNLLGAVVLIAAMLLPPGISGWAPVGTLGVFALSVAVARRGGFDLAVEHLAERHGLLMIIVFGESIVGIGSGLASEGSGQWELLTAVLAVGVVGAMWWTYFSGRDVDDAMERIRDSRAGERATFSVRAFFLDHLAMMFGLVLFAAGISLAFDSMTGAAALSAAYLMSGGVSVYLIAQALNRRELGVGGVRVRVLLGIAAPLLGVVGTTASASAELTGLLILVGATVVLSRRSLDDGDPGADTVVASS